LNWSSWHQLYSFKTIFCHLLNIYNKWVLRRTLHFDLQTKFFLARKCPITVLLALIFSPVNIEVLRYEILYCINSTYCTVYMMSRACNTIFALQKYLFKISQVIIFPLWLRVLGAIISMSICGCVFFKISFRLTKFKTKSFPPRFSIREQKFFAEETVICLVWNSFYVDSVYSEIISVLTQSRRWKHSALAQYTEKPFLENYQNNHFISL
jgi:hypothetical protein